MNVERGNINVKRAKRLDRNGTVSEGAPKSCRYKALCEKIIQRHCAHTATVLLRTYNTYRERALIIRKKGESGLLFEGLESHLINFVKKL